MHITNMLTISYVSVPGSNINNITVMSVFRLHCIGFFIPFPLNFVYRVNSSFLSLVCIT